ncbi:Protein of unknown function DUF432 [Ferroglobus placidus DSM 10642]|uniref:DUF432 domain-containing protein n=1 Tax=Ferroglobus placidus (strain DSM 10642 / AEDII12DO) TaxID=589924 RepID=D3S0L2_FERPA|nr:DUF432 domain-containing protein [Ferroglobus placidus]ADC66253.1 Protein of unknown function DUF432 [Ferroglobus placidus DSM 10642]
MYGVYELQNFHVKIKDLELGIFEENGIKIYRRDDLKKVIVADSGRVVVNPVEPVNLPKNITRYLMVELDEPIVMEPKNSEKVTLTFPIEVAVILAGKKSLEVLDVFSFVKPKYALYGDPRNGVICRYWKSEVSGEEEDFVKGKLEVEINNSSGEWVEIGKLVFDVYGMKIYYGESVVAFARANVISEKVAETEFVDKRAGKKSIELYLARRIPVVKKKFVMEWGFV